MHHGFITNRYMADKGITPTQITQLDRLAYMENRSMGERTNQLLTFLFEIFLAYGFQCYKMARLSYQILISVFLSLFI